MLVRIDHHSGVPAYRQLMDQIKLGIATGQLAPGDEVPSTRALSAEIDLNPMTISKAYSQLERDGYLLRQRGRPLTVAPYTQDERRKSARETLSGSLRQAAALSFQLGFAPEETAALFQELLSQSKSRETPDD